MFDSFFLGIWLSGKGLIWMEIYILKQFFIHHLSALVQEPIPVYNRKNSTIEEYLQMEEENSFKY